MTSTSQQGTLFGHPTGLFTLFFAEMWERFSYYGMRALLILYLTKGFLGYGDSDASGIYGAYTALVYMTPFFGGMLADRLLGERRAVVLGGLLMAAGHLLMAIEQDVAFFGALALIIAGNGFFKPNISTIVGSLYPEGSPRRDGGFTIFYIGINLGAAMSPLLCGYIGEKYGWHIGFGLATIGMLIGLAVFVLPVRGTQLLIGAGVLAAMYGLITEHAADGFSTGLNIFIAVALLSAGIIAIIALNRGGLPDEAGQPPSREKLKQPVFGLPAEWAVYAGTLVAVPVLALIVSGFSPFTDDGKSVSIVSSEWIKAQQASDSKLDNIVGVLVKEVSKPAGMILLIAGLGAAFYLLREAARMSKVARERMYVVFILTFFSLLFWAFFEQAGSSLNLFADRNVDRVSEESEIRPDDVGKTLTITPNQEQLGYMNGDKLFTLNVLDDLREKHRKKLEVAKSSGNENGESKEPRIEWSVVESNVGMKLGGSETPATVFQSINPICILIFGLVFAALWGFLAVRKIEPSTPFKFALGLLQLGLGFGCFWYGAQNSDARGMVGPIWLILGYTLHTTGELCLSPVGLSMVTKLSPARLVSTVMGAWFLATAFSNYLAGIIAAFASVSHEGGDGKSLIPPPIESVNVYGDVYGQIGVAASICAGICFLLGPLLKKWMHEDHVETPHEPVPEGPFTAAPTHPETQ